MIIRESETDYKTPNKVLIEELIGAKNCNILYEHYDNEFTMMCANENDYIKIGVDKISARRLQLAKNIIPSDVNNGTIRTSNDAYQFFKHMGNYNEEYFYILLLKSNNTVITRSIQLFKGGVGAVAVDFKSIFIKVFEHKRVSGVILAHNHPSGNVNPSKEDIELTKKFKLGCETVNLKFLDHLIITFDGYYSFLDNGDM